MEINTFGKDNKEVLYFLHFLVHYFLFKILKKNPSCFLFKCIDIQRDK